MAKLFVANTSQQKVDFIYRIPESLQTSPPLTILPGSQILVLDAAGHIIDAVIEQHRIYGVKHHHEVDTKTFNGLIYSVDEPVKLDSIFLADEANKEVLEKRGQEIRQNQAAALSEALDQTVDGDVTGLTVEIVEETKPGKEVEVAETISVEKTEKKGRRK